MFDTIKNLAFRKKLEEYVDHCCLETPEEVARLFREYTWLIWDYKMIGRIHDFYLDNTLIHVENGGSMVGAEKEIIDTLAFTGAVPDNESLFIDIFAEGNPEDGYYFMQSTKCVGTCTGYTALGEGTGRSLSEGGRDSVGLCECHVKKVDGRWKIVEEWMVRSGECIQHVMTPGSAPAVFEEAKDEIPYMRAVDDAYADEWIVPENRKQGGEDE